MSQMPDTSQFAKARGSFGLTGSNFQRGSLYPACLAERDQRGPLCESARFSVLCCPTSVVTRLCHPVCLWRQLRRLYGSVAYGCRSKSLCASTDSCLTYFCPAKQVQEVHKPLFSRGFQGACTFTGETGTALALTITDRAIFPASARRAD